MDRIKIVILISGKRKCGKDFLSENLEKRISSKHSCRIVRISEPIKSEWAKKLDLSLEQLLSDGAYKEQYRRDMIVWSDGVRAKDYGYFCRTAMKNVDVEVVIVSDVRRKNDINFFRSTYGKRVRAVRLTSSNTVRANRGWVHTIGVDDVASECDLDDYDQWDLMLENNGDRTAESLIDLVCSILPF